MRNDFPALAIPRRFANEAAIVSLHFSRVRNASGRKRNDTALQRILANVLVRPCACSAYRGEPRQSRPFGRIYSRPVRNPGWMAYFS